MSPAGAKSPTQERVRPVLSGWLMLPVVVALYIAMVALFVLAFTNGTTGSDGEVRPVAGLIIGALIALAAAIVLSPGFFTLQPNEARVLILFGNYRGTARKSGFRWANPFYSNGPAGQGAGMTGKPRASKAASPDAKKLRRYKISLRARTLNGEKLKVNDKRGNPVDIAAVVVWRVEDTAKAVFDVDDYESYVATQSETAVRHLASAYPYDSGETLAGTDDEITLRGNVDEVSLGSGCLWSFLVAIDSATSFAWVRLGAGAAIDRPASFLRDVVVPDRIERPEAPGLHGAERGRGFDEVKPRAGVEPRHALRRAQDVGHERPTSRPGLGQREGGGHSSDHDHGRSPENRRGHRARARHRRRRSGRDGRGDREDAGGDEKKGDGKVRCL